MFNYDNTYDDILDREEVKNCIKKDILDFEVNKYDYTITRGFYIYGDCSIGKTYFVKNIMKELNYDIIEYNSSDNRNKSFIQSITKNQQSEKSVISFFSKKKKNICMIMDEIDGLNMGDKGTITSLIKLIRGKRTKKQKKEETTIIPILCIGNSCSDKKIRELMNVCRCYHLRTPNRENMKNLILYKIPKLKEAHSILDFVSEYIITDLHRLNYILKICQHSSIKELKNLLNKDTLCRYKNTKKEMKDKVKYLLTNKVSIEEQSQLINETDRTTLSLLFHENVPHLFLCKKQQEKETIHFYYNFLEVFCYADYIDRITFQKQIWIFNELSFLLKTIYNNNILHNELHYKREIANKDMDFTKILTKYSTEYNNLIFLMSLCYKLDMDRKDLLSFFSRFKDMNENKILFDEIEKYEITKLDIQRMYRFIENQNK